MDGGDIIPAKGLKHLRSPATQRPENEAIVCLGVRFAHVVVTLRALCNLHALFSRALCYPWVQDAVSSSAMTCLITRESKVAAQVEPTSESEVETNLWPSRPYHGQIYEEHKWICRRTEQLSYLCCSEQRKNSAKLLYALVIKCS